MRKDKEGRLRSHGREERKDEGTRGQKAREGKAAVHFGTRSLVRGKFTVAGRRTRVDALVN
ncbi:hypothetical protein [Streptomyces cucumeris]|uniref:hypothetical protein n=1 Tax=Streptomyces cucumeris TaxID=2962890 RepID=UPI0020C849A4|nr:hypothetical protein [Streptomyces sp. NEAU-Y11]MCP9210853.1 hypothetical protein [Streptomyces sp. NEAU-Y11]